MNQPRISPRAIARIGGALYLAIIVIGAAEQFAIRGSVMVRGDVMATAANLRSMETLWRVGVGLELVSAFATTVFTVILYVLLRPVGRGLALVATAFSLIGIAVESGYALELLRALYPVQAVATGTFTPEQLAVLARMAIDAHSDGFAIALVFFGFFFPFAAYLIFRSGFLPKALGVLYALPGLSYIASSFTLLLAPDFGARWYFIIAAPAIIGEGALCLWLLFRGIDEARWRRLPSAAT